MPPPLLLLLQLLLISTAAGSSSLTLSLQRVAFRQHSEIGLVGYEQLTQKGVFPLSANRSGTGWRPDWRYCLQLSIGTPPQAVLAVADTGSRQLVVAGSQSLAAAPTFDPEASVSLVWQRASDRWSGGPATDVVRLQPHSNRSLRLQFALLLRHPGPFVAGAQWQAVAGLAASQQAVAGLAASQQAVAGLAASQQAVAGLAASQQAVAGLAASQQPSSFVQDVARHWQLGARLRLRLCPSNSSLTIGESGSDTGMLFAAGRSARQFEVVIVDVKLNGASLGMDCKEYNFQTTTVDSCSSGIQLPKRVFRRVTEQLDDFIPKVGPQFYSGASLLCHPQSSDRPWRQFPVISISLLLSASQSFDLHVTPRQYLQEPADQQLQVAGMTCYRFLLQEGSETVLGSSLLEGFAVDFDLGGRRIGFGNSTCGHANASSGCWVSGRLQYPPSQYSPSAWDCAFASVGEAGGRLLLPAAAALPAVWLLCSLPVCALLLLRRSRRCRRGPAPTDETLRLVAT